MKKERGMNCLIGGGFIGITIRFFSLLLRHDNGGCNRLLMQLFPLALMPCRCCGGRRNEGSYDPRFHWFSHNNVVHQEIKYGRSSVVVLAILLKTNNSIEYKICSIGHHMHITSTGVEVRKICRENVHLIFYVQEYEGEEQLMET